MAVQQAETQLDDFPFPRRQRTEHLADPFTQQHLIDVFTRVTGTVVVQKVGQASFRVVAQTIRAG